MQFALWYHSSVDQRVRPITIRFATQARVGPFVIWLGRWMEFTWLQWHTMAANEACVMCGELRECHHT